MTPIFYRAGYSQIVVSLTASEPLGKLQTEYIEDLAGVDGQATLTGPDRDREVLVTGLDAGHERFRAFIALANLPDGLHRLRGRVRDVAGNWAELDLPFELRSGLGLVVQPIGGWRLAGALGSVARPVGSQAPRSGPVARPGATGAAVQPMGVTWQAAR